MLKDRGESWIGILAIFNIIGAYLADNQELLLTGVIILAIGFISLITSKGA